MTRLILAISMALVALPAQAGWRHHSYHSTVYLTPWYPGAAIYELRHDPLTEAARSARITKWEAYCQPKLVPYGNGVMRYAYTDLRCEEGYHGQ